MLAEHGYVYNWLWYSLKDSTEGSREPLDPRIPEELPETQRMIMRLALQLSPIGKDFCLYLGKPAFIYGF